MAATTTRVVMPQLGESVHEGTISRWLVKPGDRINEFEPMLEVDTDKVNAEVPAPVSGILREILAKEGDTIAAGAEIAVIETSGAQRVRPSEAPTLERAAEPQPPRRDEDGGREHYYSPAVLTVASELKVDLSKVAGTGLGGRVTRKDVQDYAAKATAAGVASQSANAATKRGQGDQVVPLTRARKLIAENMARSKQTIPHAWQTQEVDMSGVVANRNANKVQFQQHERYSLTYLPYVMAAAAAGLREHPMVNSTFNDTEIIVHSDINLGVSVGMEDTLLVPVVRKADSLSLGGLARAVNDLAASARSKQLKADELAGGTFTVNNSGTFGTLFSYSVINPGQTGILTMGAIVERPVAAQGMIGIKPMMYLCFSLDHRVLDGLQASRFLTSVRVWLEAVTVETPIF